MTGAPATSNEAWQWQRSATEAGAPTATSPQQRSTPIQYTPSAGDLGMWLKATVTYDDVTGTDWIGEETARERVLSQPTLSNAGHGHHGIIEQLARGNGNCKQSSRARNRADPVGPVIELLLPNERPPRGYTAGSAP